MAQGVRKTSEESASSVTKRRTCTPTIVMQLLNTPFKHKNVVMHMWSRPMHPCTAPPQGARKAMDRRQALTRRATVERKTGPYP